jgi:hypothetical protein
MVFPTQQKNNHTHAYVIVKQKEIYYVMDPERVRAYLQVACTGLGFDIGEIWWTSGVSSNSSSPSSSPPLSPTSSPILVGQGERKFLEFPCKTGSLSLNNYSI